MAELPYTFRERFSGESKLDSAVLWQYLLLLIDKKVGRWVPARFVMFAMVGGSGVAVHFLVLSLLLALHQGFTTAQAEATVIAMVSNFVINNVFTYRDRRLHGAAFFRGMLGFMLACGIGAVANVGVAGAMFASHYQWWLAAMAGVMVGVVWNFVTTSVLTWRK